MTSPRKEQHMYAGVIAGLASTVILNPIDVIKTRYQVYDGRGSAYSSLLGAVRTIARKEGVRGFCSGMLPASIAATVSWGGYFYFYEGCKTRWLNSVRARDGPTAELSHTQVLLSGIEAGSMMVLITNPLWLIKTRLQLQGSAAPIVVAVPGTAVSTGSVVAATSATTAQRHYSGLVDAVSCIVREEGVRGLYRGLLPALFLTSHGAVQFVTYEFLKKKVHMMGWSTRRGGSSSSSNSGSGSGSRTPGGGGGKDHLDIPVYLTAALGFMSKLVAATTTYPYQVVKSRLQQREVLVAAETGTGTSSVLRAQAKYRGTLDCMRQIVRHEGLVGFYKGYVANCLKVAPSAAITFAVYEYALKLISTRYE